MVLIANACLFLQSVRFQLYTHAFITYLSLLFRLLYGGGFLMAFCSIRYRIGYLHGRKGRRITPALDTRPEGLRYAAIQSNPIFQFNTGMGYSLLYNLRPRLLILSLIQ